MAGSGQGRRINAVTIEIQRPELEALIHQRMASGAFQSVEDVLMQALECAPVPFLKAEQCPRRSGLELLKVMQTMPYKDEIDIESPRLHMPVRDVIL